MMLIRSLKLSLSFILNFLFFKFSLFDSVILLIQSSLFHFNFFIFYLDFNSIIGHSFDFLNFFIIKLLFEKLELILKLFIFFLEFFFPEICLFDNVFSERGSKLLLENSLSSGFINRCNELRLCVSVIHNFRLWKLHIRHIIVLFLDIYCPCTTNFRRGRSSSYQLAIAFISYITLVSLTI
jgi:hypothetical protein